MDTEKKLFKADLRFDSIEDLGKELFLKSAKETSPDKKIDKSDFIDTKPLNLVQVTNDESKTLNTLDTLPLKLGKKKSKNSKSHEAEPEQSFAPSIPPQISEKEQLEKEKEDEKAFIKKLDNPALEELLGLYDSSIEEPISKEKERENEKAFIKKLDNPALEELLGLSDEPVEPPKAIITPPKPPAPPPPETKNRVGKEPNTIERLTKNELNFLFQKGEPEVVSKPAEITQPEGVIEEEDMIETLSSTEISRLAEKFANLNENDLLSIEINENKMQLVQTFDGLKLNQVLPETPELTVYKPNFVLTDTAKVDENVTGIKQGKTFARKFDFYEVGSFLGITVGQSSKFDVIKIMRDYGSEIFKPKENDKNKSYFAKDLSLSVSFDDDGIVNELTLGSEFKGQTSKGVRIGDPIKRIFEIYGKADIYTPISFTWGKFVIFHKNGVVTHFRALSK
jgi:hypothetical protein